ncbi:MAG: response regulator transcription factor [Rhodospirillaceae bacterium]|nr:MAG: response regulator transcription factor [Rhodospirillaceae bacterium]
MSTPASDVTRRRILLVDDDPALRETLAEQLGVHEEYSVGQAENGSEAIEAIDADHFDAIVLDVGLPDMDGRDLCKLMRRRGVKAPIIMLTGQDSDADAILGLDAGANDYITKPFRFNVFMARVRAQLRTHEQSDDAVFTVGPYAFLPAAKMLTNNETDRKIRLTEKETAILKFLYRAGGKVVSRDTLLDEVWGYNAGVNTHTLETHVYRLRQKVEPDPQRNAILVTEPGGYRLGV